MDYGILMCVIALVIIGVIMVYSASYIKGYYNGNGKMSALFFSNLKFAIIGFFIMILASKVNYKLYRNIVVLTALWLICMGFLIMVKVKGIDSHGAQRWLDLGFIRFQPSEVVKMTCIIITSAIMSGKNFDKNSGKDNFNVLIWSGVLIFLLALQPHISAIGIIVVSILTIQFASCVPWKIIIIEIIIMSLILAGIIFTSSYAKGRLAVYTDDENAATEHVLNSLYAISSGEIKGKGFGKSIQKYMYLAEPYNDFIFSVYAEETGFIGCLILIFLFFVLTLRCLNVARNAPDKFSYLLAVGITTQIAFQFVFNIGVTLGLLPVTGISLPFISYGGTALLITMGMAGIILNISRYSKI